jgi:hypothetical protein
MWMQNHYKKQEGGLVSRIGSRRELFAPFTLISANNWHGIPSSLTSPKVYNHDYGTTN